MKKLLLFPFLLILTGCNCDSFIQIVTGDQCITEESVIQNYPCIDNMSLNNTEYEICNSQYKFINTQ